MFPELVGIAGGLSVVNNDDLAFLGVPLLERAGFITVRMNPSLPSCDVAAIVAAVTVDEGVDVADNCAVCCN